MPNDDYIKRSDAIRAFAGEPNELHYTFDIIAKLERIPAVNAGMPRYQRLKAEGICVSCGFRPADGGSTRCTYCRERANAWKRAYRKKYGSGRPRGRPRKYDYVLIREDGAEVCAGSAEEVAACLGVSKSAVLKFWRTKTIRLKPGWKIERRDILENKENADEG